MVEANPVQRNATGQSAYVTQKIEAGQPFIDEDFPANVQSLMSAADVNDPTVDAATKQFFQEGIVWRRASELYEGSDAPLSVFFNNEAPVPSSVMQGRMADCYFLSGLSGLASEGNRVAELFNTKQANAAGIYSMLLYVNGVRKEVIVDDYFPCDAVSQRPCFAHS